MYIQLNGQVIYYEKTGEGSPILLVHGNGESIKTFEVLIPALSKKHTVYALDSRGHGKSAAVSEYHYADMAEDVAAFVQALDLVKPAFYGFSDGGIVGLLAASKYPTLFSALAISGANLTPSGCRLAERIKDRLHYMKTKDPLTKLMMTEPHITKEDLSKITIPTLVLAGAKDCIKRSETKRIADNISDSTLKILPGEDHFSYVVKSPKLFPILDEFFSAHCY
ncbi:MAG: alpha/beta hydrolase [Lachnospiraceae bacterium]|nr:alpha/beta hydrolase [Lachnospiraceae bacterium]